MPRPPSRTLTGKGSRTEPVVVLEPLLVPITPEQEHQTLLALADLLAPLSTKPPDESEEGLEGE